MSPPQGASPRVPLCLELDGMVTVAGRDLAGTPMTLRILTSPEVPAPSAPTSAKGGSVVSAQNESISLLGVIA